MVDKSYYIKMQITYCKTNFNYSVNTNYWIHLREKMHFHIHEIVRLPSKWVYSNNVKSSALTSLKSL